MKRGWRTTVDRLSDSNRRVRMRYKHWAGAPVVVLPYAYVLIVICVAAGYSSAGESADERLKRFERVRVDAKNFARVQNLHVNWHGAAVKALLGQLGRELYRSLPSAQKLALARCLDQIDDKKDITISSRCLVEARGRLGPNATASTTTVFNTTVLGSIMFTDSRWHDDAWQRAKNFAKTSYRKRNKWKVRQADGIRTLLDEADRSPIVRVTNLIANFAGNSANSTDPTTVKWSSVYRKLAALKSRNDAQRRAPGALVYDLRMYDLVLDRRQPSKSRRQRKSLQGIMEEAFDLLSSLSGVENAERRRNSNLNVLSPRLAPLMPDKAAASSARLSPTLFALYDDNDDHGSSEVDGSASDARFRRLRGGKKSRRDDLASMPKLLKRSGLSETDREAIVSLLMDVSGAAKTVDDAVRFLDGLNFFEIEDEIFESHEHVDRAYDRLHDSLAGAQTVQLDARGFTFLRRAQLERLVGEQGVNVTATDVGLGRLPPHDFADGFSSAADLEESLWRRIECIADHIPDEECTADAYFSRRHGDASSTLRGLYRHKRDLETPSVLAPTVLAPFSFTPIFGLSVLGPVVLSPSLFAPLILNPAVLSPFVLSPSVGMPFILSPYLLTPYVLSPLVMAPFILNPYVLSPNVLNPYLLSPLILSPLVLCPDVLSPMALGGSVLSPSVGSPAVLTETALMANWLSPSFLSR